MNDLALDLAVKAGYSDRGNGSYKNFDLEKYAELIIQECAKAYHKTRLSETPIETHFRHHFGIEE